MSAYVILDAQVTDPELYDQYKKIGPPTVAQYGGRYIARGGTCETLEGDWHLNRVVIIEFPSREQAKAWLNSQEYAPAREMRRKASTSRMVVVEGI